MGTRSNIMVTGNCKYNTKSTVRLYRHYDGYPNAQLPLFKDTLDVCIKLMEGQEILVETFCGKLLGEATDKYGMRVEFEEKFQDEFNPEMIGNQGDVEWVYLIDLKNKSIKVYKGAMSEAVERGTVDPRSYSNQLTAEFQAESTEQITEAMVALEVLGYSINPEPPQPIETESKRGPGRPKGAKNKPKPTVTNRFMELAKQKGMIK